MGCVLIWLISAPRVEEFKPQPGSPGAPSLSRIELRFNRPMDRLSVESRLQIDPEQNGKFYWDDQTLIFEPDEPWPTKSRVEVTLASGSRGLNRLPMLGSRRWTFNVGLPSLIYLWPAEGKGDLFQVGLEPQNEPIPLTRTETGILDYSISLDGTSLVYIANREGGGTEMHLLNLISGDDRILLSCAAVAPCGTPALSLDGDWLAFVKEAFSLGAAGRLLPSGSSVWVMALETEQEPFQVSPANHSANAPEWSPTGWLIYFDDRLKALALVNLNEGRDPTPFNYIPTSLGIVGSWSPDGTGLVFPDILFPDEETPEQGPLYYSHLFMVDITSGRTVDISPGADWMVEDASPSFSPDERWVAFTRKYLDPERWSPGRQIWLMNTERTDLRMLTDEPGATFSSLSWSPDSRRLAFMRKNVADLAQPSEVGWLDVVTGEISIVVAGATLPGWLP